MSMISREDGQQNTGAIAAALHSKSPWESMFYRLFGANLLRCMLLIGFAVVMANSAFIPDEFTKDSDLWWHLADARILTTTHHFIRVEPYSFAVAGERWSNPEWLAEIPYWLGYSHLGLRGIHLAALMGLCGNLIFLYFRSCWKSRSNQAAFWTAVLAFFLMSINGGARTIVMAYLAMSAEMALIEGMERGRKWLVWFMPPLFCLWINLHGSWIFGIGFFGLYILCGLFPVNVGAFEQQAFSPADRTRILCAFIASVAALIVNPYGWRLIWNPLDMQLNQKLMIQVIEEWQPLSPNSSVGIAAIVAICLMILCNLVKPRKWKVYELMFILFAWYFAFLHQRLAYLACIVTIPWLAADVARSFYGESSEKTIPVLNLLFSAAIVAALIFYFPKEAILEQDLASGMPLQTIASIQPSWRTFSDYKLSGRLAFQSKPDFLDSRIDTFEHHGILKPFLDIENSSSRFQLLDANRIDHVLTSSNTALALALEHARGWQLVRREGSGDDSFELFARLPGTPAE
jgi:hypothetical protein